MGTFTEIEGDLLDFDVIAHGVNIRAAMISGVAGQIAARWPALEADYNDRCEHNELQLGTSYAYPVDGKTVFQCVSQVERGADARLHAINTSVANTLRTLECRNVRQLALPRIGCGVGGLDWADVRPILALMARNSRVDITIAHLPTARNN